MKPTSFPQMTGTLARPLSMTEEQCSPLPVYYAPYTGEPAISCWKPTWRERVQIFFGMPVWLWVHSTSHPPVSLEVQNPFDSP